MPPALPLVSACCITYGRTACLEEAIRFFLDQDYPGPKELVVVNDLPEQRLVFDHPEVRIVNLPERVPTIGEKRNFAVRETRGEILLCWDDDDGYLPHHVSSCVGYLADADYARPDKCFFLDYGARTLRVRTACAAQHVFTRAAFDRTEGYPAINSGQDVDFDRRVRRVGRCYAPALAPHEITYLLLWGNEAYHLSAHRRDRAGRPSGYDLVGERVARGLAAGEIPSGEIRLRPAFRHDYYGFVTELLRRLVP